MQITTKTALTGVVSAVVVLHFGGESGALAAGT